MAMPQQGLTRLTWDEFVEIFPWQQGEHVVIVGTIGSGKSTLLRSLMHQRNWAVVFGSKKRDKTYDRYLASGYERVTKWPPPKQPKGQNHQHVLLWPKITKIEDLYTLGPTFQKALDAVFIDECWAVGLDDLYYLSKVCRLEKQITALNYQVRSTGVSLVSCMQRPSWVPRSCWDQASYAFLSRLSDKDDVRNIQGLSRVSTKELYAWLDSLRKYEWLYLPVNDPDAVPAVIRPDL